MLTPGQKYFLKQMADGGHLEYGLAGGILSYIYNERTYSTRTTNGNTIRAMFKRGYIEQDGNRIVISATGRAAIAKATSPHAAGEGGESA